jgi:MFS family permease
LDAPIASKWEYTVRAFRHRNFRLFFGGQIISLIGTWMQNVAQAWLVYRLTSSPFLLGLVGFSSQIPVFLLAPIGGAVADRKNRHRVVIATQTASLVLAFCLAGVTLSGVVQVWHILLLSVFLGVVNAFDIPARQAFIVEMVGREDMTNAIALNSSMFNSARIIGPAIAGLLVAAIGEGWCFFVNGVSYIAVIVGLVMMHVQSRTEPQSTRSVVSHILEGFRFVANTGPIRTLLLLLGLVSLVGMPYAVLMPIFADNILHGGPRGLGILMGVSGVGAVAGALLLASKRGLRGLGRWIAYSTVGFGASLMLFAVSRNLWLSAAILVPTGFCMMVQMAASNTLIQTMVPDALRGRVMSVYSMMFMGMAPFGALGAGVVAARLGAPLTVMIGASVCLMGAALFWVKLSAFRVEARELILGQQMSGGGPPDQTIGARVS